MRSAVSVRKGRGWMAALAGAVAVAATIGAGAWLSNREATGDPASPAVADATPARVESGPSELGLVVAARVTFDEPVTLSGSRIRAGASEVDGWLWPLDGADHEGENHEVVDLPAGIPVTINGLVRPQCDGTTVDLVFSVTSENAHGVEEVRRYSPDDPAGLAADIAKYCRQGPTVRAEMNRLSPDGDAVIGVVVSNPTPDEIRIEVPALEDEHVTWTALRGVVPPGEQVRFEIHGTDVGCEAGERASWLDGRLLVDGEPFDVRDDDAWC